MNACTFYNSVRYAKERYMQSQDGDYHGRGQEVMWLDKCIKGALTSSVMFYSIKKIPSK